MSKNFVNLESLFNILTGSIVVLSASYFLTFPAFSQAYPIPRGYRQVDRNRLNTTIIKPPMRQLDPAGRATNNISGLINYPTGSRVYSNGTVQIPNGRVSAPASVIKHGDGSTSYYYPDGSHIDTNGSHISPLGRYIQ